MELERVSKLERVSNIRTVFKVETPEPYLLVSNLCIGTSFFGLAIEFTENDFDPFLTPIFLLVFAYGTLCGNLPSVRSQSEKESG